MSTAPSLRCAPAWSKPARPRSRSRSAAEDATKDDRTVAYKDNRIFLMRTMTYKEPFIDPRVRMAISHAIDREAIVPALMGITGSPWYQMLGPQVNGYIPGFDETEVRLSTIPRRQSELLPRRRPTATRSRPSSTSSLGPTCSPAATRWSRPSARTSRMSGFKFQHFEHGYSAWLKYLRAPFPPEQRPTLQMISHDNTSGDASFSFPRYITCKGVVSATCNPKIDELVKQADIGRRRGACASLSGGGADPLS